MKKKIFTLLFAIVASVGIVFASDTQVDGIWYDFDSNTQTATVTYQGDDASAYKEYSGDIVIPSSVKFNNITYSVTSIGYAAFWACGITSIEIPNSVTRIESSAFYGCSDLTSIDIPNSVTNIVESAFYGCYGLTSVTIPGSVTGIENYTFSQCRSLTFIIIPNSVTSIGQCAFEYCSGLKSVTIPSSITRIGYNAFYNCNSLTSITCEAVNPPTCDYKTFEYVSRSIPIYVPANSVSAYKDADIWSEWGDNIKPIQAAEVVATDMHANPTNNNVTIEWPYKEDATVYTITIKKGDKTICTIEFNAQGQLLTISFAAPSRNDNNRQTSAVLQTATGWQYTISGLEPGTEYSYTVVAKNSAESVVYNNTITFKTAQTATGVNEVQSDKVQGTKVLRDGQIIFISGDKVYTLTGAEVRRE